MLPALGGLNEARAPLPHLAHKKYVRSPFDFIVNIYAHKERAALLALEICQRFPEACGDVRPELIAYGLRHYHDAEKHLLDEKFLQHYNWTLNSRAFFHLVNRYGRSADRKIIDRMNNDGDALVYPFLLENGLATEDGDYTAKGLIYKQVETWADVLDAILDEVRREEFPGPVNNIERDFSTPLGKKILATIGSPDEYEKITATARFSRMKEQILEHGASFLRGPWQSATRSCPLLLKNNKTTDWPSSL